MRCLTFYQFCRDQNYFRVLIDKLVVSLRQYELIKIVHGGDQSLVQPQMRFLKLDTTFDNTFVYEYILFI